MKRIRVSDYYKDELFRFMPEAMFDLIDEAWFNGKVRIFVPDHLMNEFNKNKSK